MAHMIDNLKIPPSEVLGVSFTNKAAKEMRERMHTLLGKRKSKGLTLCTFHSLCVRILKNEIHLLGYSQNFSIYDQADSMSIIREALKNFKTEKEKFDRKIILTQISNLKNLGVYPENFSESSMFDPEDPYAFALEHCYRYYQDKLKFFNAIDFDDILQLTVRLFKENQHIAEKYSQKYKYLIIDEYQDTNNTQFQLVMALTSTHQNICVVGDDDQSIYAFRGADVSNILNFEQIFNSAKTIKLEQNYRSTKPILALANRVIIENTNRKDKTLWSDIESTQLPTLWAMADTDHEAAVIADEINKYASEGGHLGDIALLIRSKTQAPVLENELMMAQIPYRYIGGQKLFEKKEVKDILAYLSVILNPSDELSLRRVLNVPSRGIGNITLDKYLAQAKEKNQTLFSTLETSPHLDTKRSVGIQSFTRIISDFKKYFEKGDIAETISRLIEEINYREYINKCYDDQPKQALRRQEDMMRFIEGAARYQTYFKDSANLKDFIERQLLQDNQDTEETEDDDIRPNEVTLMTLHSSKGLEFDIVYMVGMEEDTLPHKRVIQEGGDLNEELRLAYVGITRARRELYMTYCKERKIYGENQPRHPSRFISQYKKLFNHQDRTTFGHLSPQEAEDYKKDFFSGLLDSLD